jgi:hypothetical protein
MRQGKFGAPGPLEGIIVVQQRTSQTEYNTSKERKLSKINNSEKKRRSNKKHHNNGEFCDNDLAEEGTGKVAAVSGTTAGEAFGVSF